MAPTARPSVSPDVAIHRLIRRRLLLYALAIPLFIGSCGLVLSPTQASPADPDRIAASLVADPTCLRVTFTFAGSSGITTSFPNRTLCNGGLVVVPGGTATRSGSGNKNANIPVRLLNLGAYAVQTPAKLVLAPGDRVVLVPSGGAASKVTPQNHDSLRASTGSWVWMMGSAGSVVVGDSTAAKTLTIKMDSPASSAQLTFTAEGQQLSSGGWPLVYDAPTTLDTAVRVTAPPAGLEYLRRNVMLRFEAEVSDSAKIAFFNTHQLVVLGVTEGGLFYVRTPDPGPTYAQYDSMLQALSAATGIMTVSPLLYSQLELSGSARYPIDKLARSKWFTAADSLWAMRAIRAPQAWGCETGDYGGGIVRAGILEVHNVGGYLGAGAHPELAYSTPVKWAPSDIGMTGIPATSAVRNRQYAHSAWTTGLLSASGDNTQGIAGVAWKTQLLQFALSSPQGRHGLPNKFPGVTAEIKRQAPRVLSISAEMKLPGVDSTRRREMLETIAGEWQVLLNDLPELTIVVASGNDRFRGSVATYLTDTIVDLMRGSLLMVKQIPGYEKRVIVVSGTIPGNQGWDVYSGNSAQGSNVFTDGIDIAAPAENVLVMDTVKVGGVVDVRLIAGTSMSAPQVAGAAALLLSMDPALTPTNVYDYLVDGAKVERLDSLTGVPVPVSAVQGNAGGSFYQLDLYGALTLLAKSRPGLPICGYHANPRPGGPYVYLYRNGPLALHTDSIRIPGALQAANVGSFGMAPGGRRLSAYVTEDSLSPTGNGFYDQAIIHFTYQGVRTGAAVGHYGARIYLERNILDIRFFTPNYQRANLLTPSGTQVASMILHNPDGSTIPIGGQQWSYSGSPDGRFVSFPGASGYVVQRWSDQQSMLLPASGVPVWSKDGTKLVQVSGTGGSSPTITLTEVKVDSTPTGGFQVGQSVTVGGQLNGNWLLMSGDDAVLYTGQTTLNPFAFHVIRRPMLSLGTVTGDFIMPSSLHAPVANIVAGVRER